MVLKSFAETWRSHPNGGTPSLPFNGGKPGGTSAAAGGTPSLPFNGGTPSLPFNGGTPALPFNGGTPSLPFNGGTPSLLCGTPGGTSAAAVGTPSLPFNGGTPSLHRFLRPLFFPFNINVLY